MSRAASIYPNNSSYSHPSDFRQDETAEAYNKASYNDDNNAKIQTNNDTIYNHYSRECKYVEKVDGFNVYINFVILTFSVFTIAKGLEIAS